LVTSVFGIERLYAVVGWSMGAAQTFQWAVSYPDMVQRIMPFCGAARTSEHNHDVSRQCGCRYRADAGDPRCGMRAAARCTPAGLQPGVLLASPVHPDGFRHARRVRSDFWRTCFTETETPMTSWP